MHFLGILWEELPYIINKLSNLGVSDEELQNESYQEQCNLLKLVTAIFYQIFVFPPNDSPSKTMKNVFYFIKKALFFPEIFKLL